MKMFRRKMVLEKAEGSLEKVAMGSHEREKEGINKASALERAIAELGRGYEVTLQGKENSTKHQLSFK